MDRPSPRRLAWALPGQCAALLLATGLALAPPAQGRMLLIPLDGRTTEATFTAALRHGAMPLAVGPAAGWLLVRSTGVDTRRALLAEGIVPVAAPPSGCAG